MFKLYKMKKPFIILLFLSMPCLLLAQEKVKQKENGLTFSNLDNFGLTFRTGTDKSLWRFNTLFLSGNSNERTADSSLYKRTDTGIGKRGVEKIPESDGKEF